MVGITGDPRILILDGLTPFVVRVVCQFVRGHFVSVSSVRPSGVISAVKYWIIKYLTADIFLLATSWAASRRLHLLATKQPVVEAIQYASV